MSEEKSNKSTFEHLYLKERKKAQIFITASVVLIILLVGSIVIGVNKKPEVATTTPPNGAFPFGNTNGGSGGFPGGGQQLIGNVKDFLKSDGTVNQAKVDELLGRLPEQFRDRISTRINSQIDEALSKSEITEQQATELKKAFGI